MAEFLNNMWVLIVAGVGFTSGVLLLFNRISAMKREVRDNRKEFADRQTQEALRQQDVERRLAGLEGWKETVDKRDAALMEMHEKVLSSIQELRADNATQHGAMREYIHDEVRRLEEKSSDRAAKLHERIDGLVKPKRGRR